MSHQQQQSQSLASASVTATTGINDAAATDSASIQPLQLQHQQQNQQHHAAVDDDYVQFMKSLGSLDNLQLLQSVLEDDDEDVEFHLSDIEDEEEDDDDDNDDDQMAFSIPQPQNQHDEKSNAPPAVASTSPPSLLLTASPSMDLTRWSQQQYDSDDDEDEDLLDPDFFKDIDEELGGLFEEDLEATLQSLYVRPAKIPTSTSTKTSEPAKTKDATTTTTGGDMTSATSAAVTTSKTTTKNATNKNKMASKNAKISQPKIPADLSEANATTAPGDAVQSLPQSTTATSSSTIPDPKEVKLRDLLQKHYQLLIQQCILSIRAAKELKDQDERNLQQLQIQQQQQQQQQQGSTVTAAASTTTTAISSTISDVYTTKLYGLFETEMDLGEVLDLAVSMLQDLDQVRKDAVRNGIQLLLNIEHNENSWGGNKNSTRQQAVDDDDDDGDNENNNDDHDTSLNTGRRSLMAQFDECTTNHAGNTTKTTATTDSVNIDNANDANNRRLTRSAFQQRYLDKGQSQLTRTAFDIPGLRKLNETFAIIDASIGAGTFSTSNSTADGTKQPSQQEGKQHNILQAATHTQACRDVLQEAGAQIIENMLPAGRDIAKNFTSIQEYLEIDHTTAAITTTPEQELALRKDFNLFTAAEDNLILRGVNLYGEKQWLLIADRYLPDRSVNSISHRYNQLCVMIYQANGVPMDAKGNLPTPPKLESVDDIDEGRFKQYNLQQVKPPDILNVHRWSLEEDLALLKAVPIMGNMWAELAARLIPHRDRGHLRKRYQVLERRIKSTIAKKENPTKTMAKAAIKAQAWSATPTITTMSKPPTVKSAATIPVTKKTEPAKKSALAKTVTNTSPVPSKKSIIPAASKSTQLSSKATKVSSAAATKKLSPRKNARKLPSATKCAVKKTALAGSSLATTSAAASLAETDDADKDSLVQAATTLAFVKGNTPSPQRTKNTPGQQQQQPHPYDQFHPGYGAYPYGPWHYPPGYDPANGMVYGYHAYPSTYPYAYPYGQPPYTGQLPPSSAKRNIVGGTKLSSAGNTAPSSTALKTQTTTERGQATTTTVQSQASTGEPTTKSRSTPDTSPSKFVPFRRSAADGEASRLAFEKIINDEGGGDGEWSQLSLSRMKMMMANDDESEAANAIVSHLAKSPRRTGKLGEMSMSQFPIGFDTSEVSGLSVLNEASRQAYGTLKQNNDSNIANKSSNGSGEKKRSSILSQVLANTKHKDSHRTTMTGKPSSSNNNNVTTASLPQLAPVTAADKCLTPSKSGSRQRPLIGSLLSSAADSLMSPTTMLRAGAGLNTNMSLPPYSPTTNSNIVGVFDAVVDHSNNNSLAATAATTSVVGGGSNNSLLMAPNDDDLVEAVSALEALSNSPFHCPPTATAASLSQSPSIGETAAALEADNGDNDSHGPSTGVSFSDATRKDASAGAPSLFSRVIGGAAKRKQTSTVNKNDGTNDDDTINNQGKGRKGNSSSRKQQQRHSSSRKRQRGGQQWDDPSPKKKLQF